MSFLVKTTPEAGPLLNNYFLSQYSSFILEWPQIIIQHIRLQQLDFMNCQVRQRQIDGFKLVLTLDYHKLTIKVQEIETQQQYCCQFIRGQLPSYLKFHYKIEEIFADAVLEEDLRIDKQKTLMILRKFVLNKKIKNDIEVKLVKASHIVEKKADQIRKQPTLLDLGSSIKDFCFFDIETTGLRYVVGDQFKITSIVLFDGKEVRTYVDGVNLPQFKEDVGQFKAVITFNGLCFDFPETARELGIDWGAFTKFDLMRIYRGLGIRGGLKKIKEELNIAHPLLRDLNGLSAPILWAKHLEGDPHALRVLLAYNAEDVIPMRYMVEYACQLIRRRNGIALYSAEQGKADAMMLSSIREENETIMKDFLERIQVDLGQVQRLIEKKQQLPTQPE